MLKVKKEHVRNTNIQSMARDFISAIAILVALLIFTNEGFAQTPDFIWAKRAGGASYSYGDCASSVTTDKLGNSIAIGNFQGTVTFDTITLTAYGGRYDSDMFIAKYDASGNALWAKHAGGASYGDCALSIATDKLGNSIVTGNFQGTATFDTITLNAFGGQNDHDMFIAKYDALGNVLWAKQGGGVTMEDRGIGIATDELSNSIVTGEFAGTVTFGTTTLTSAGDDDMFIVKYDSSGNVLWAKNTGGTGRDIGYSITTDRLGNCMVIGTFQGMATFDTVTLVSYDYEDIFIAKYDPSGNVRWAKRAGGTTYELGTSIATDRLGNSIIAGSFEGTVKFDTISLQSIGYADMFITKYDASGNVLWSKQAGGTGWVWGNGITIDGSGNSIVTGGFRRRAIFGEVLLISTGEEDIFIAKYDRLGNVLWAKCAGAGGTNDEQGNGVDTDMSGNSIIVGSFQGIATFDTVTLVCNGRDDIFIAKLAEEPTTDIGFRANPDGFDFGNFDTNRLRTWEMFKLLMGEDACEVNGRPRPEVYRYYEEKYKTLPAACVGMSGASLINYYDVDESNVAPFDMQNYLPLYQGGHNSDKDTSIAYYHGVQTGLPFQLFRDQGEPNQIFNRIKSYIQNREPVVICYEYEYQDKRGGHCVVPYQFSEHLGGEGGLGWVQIYDCERPGDDNLILRFDLTNNTWEYGSVSGTAENPRISLVPISIFTITGIPYWQHDLSQPPVLAANDNYFSIPKGAFDNRQISARYHLVYGNGPAHFLFTDESGNRLGFDDDGNFYDEIDGAFPVVKYGSTDSFQQPGEFIFPAEVNYSAIVYGADTGLVNFTAIGDGFFARIRNASMSDSSVDQVYFSEDGSTLVYSTSDRVKNYSVTVDRELADESRSFLIDNTSITQGDTAQFHIIDDQAVRYVNIGNDKSYDLTIVRVGADSEAFVCTNVPIGANETHIVTPTDWQALDTTEVLLEIDQGNDGSIDSSATLRQTTKVKYDVSHQSVRSFALLQNYPNPFNSQTTIGFSLPTPARVVLKIYSVLGEEVCTLLDEQRPAGCFSVHWDGKNNLGIEMPSGLYFYNLTADNFTQNLKMLLLR